MLLWLIVATVSNALGAWPDPNIRTKGEIWPQPQYIEYKVKAWPVSKSFHITTTSKCDIVVEAVRRFTKQISQDLEDVKGIANGDSEELTSLQVVVQSEDCPKYPTLGMDESYKIFANTTESLLVANEAWGALRALESFSQLFFYNGTQKLFHPAIVNDHPRFPHRGLLLDTSRHYFSSEIIKAILELMALNKLNVFHWHIVDNEAFPYVPQAYPEMAKGAYGSNHVYTGQVVKEIIDFARTRGIRVVPEFDTPGHTASWRGGLDFMTTRCFNKQGVEDDVRNRGMLDVSSSLMWDTLIGLFKEVFELFPDQYFHLGGDETEYWMENCWMNNKNITDFMKEKNLKNEQDLEQWYFTNLMKQFGLKGMNKTFMVWQEVLDMGVDVGLQVVGHVWKGNTPSEQMNEMTKVVKEGHFAVLSSCWYLDHISSNPDYEQYYACDPQNFTATPEELNLVLGGEAAMWGEMVDASNVIARIFPRASAIAEKLWSDQQFTKTVSVDKEVWPRLQEMQCRMVRRGYPAQPANGPSFCEVEYIPNLPTLV